MTPPMDRNQLRFNVLRNALYHTMRRDWFERVNRVFNFAVIILGMSAVLGILATWGWSASWAGAAVAVVGALQLVFDFGRSARDHQHLQREYYHLLAEIEGNVTPKDIHLANWSAKMILITAEEPPVLRAADAKAYNEAIDATDNWGSGERLHIPFWRNICGHFISFNGYHFKKLSERKGYRVKQVSP